MSSNLILTVEMLNDCKVQQIMTCRNDDVILNKPESASHYSILTFFLKHLISCKCHCIHIHKAKNWIGKLFFNSLLIFEECSFCCKSGYDKKNSIFFLPCLIKFSVPRVHFLLLFLIIRKNNMIRSPWLLKVEKSHNYVRWIWAQLF